jgi:hypothetical protein
MQLRSEQPTPEDRQPQGGGEEPTLAELLERAKKLDEQVREHLKKLGLMGRSPK